MSINLTNNDLINQYQWPISFWPDFIAHYWERDPVSFACPSAEPFIDLKELFDVVTSMPSRVKSDRFWIAKHGEPKSHKDFRFGSLNLLGPQTCDVNFDGYFKRLSRHRTGVNIHNLHKSMPSLWSRVQALIDNLNNPQGHIKAENWDMDTFFGTYHSTPFGIHKDPASVFSFVLMGERTYCTWKMDYFKPNDKALHTPDLDVIQSHLKRAQTFTVKPGEVFYWPSNRWHVVLSNGEPSVVAQISAYFKPVQSGIKVK